MARKAVTQELSRQRILDKARELVGTHGYRALTMAWDLYEHRPQVGLTSPESA